jgi:hypothetical protein
MQAVEGVRLRTSSGGRVYHIDGRVYPSVTTILGALAKPGLVSWAANLEREAVLGATEELLEEYQGAPPRGDAWRALVEQRLGAVRAHRRALQTAADVGTALHARVEWELRRRLGEPVGFCPQVPDAAEWAWMVCEEWLDTAGFVPVAAERIVYSATHGYAGTADVIGTLDGRLVVLDIKTSRAIYPEMLLQSVAYRHALQEMESLDELPDGLIMRLPKSLDDAKPEIVATGDGGVLDVFLAIKRVWEWLEGGVR